MIEGPERLRLLYEMTARLADFDDVDALLRWVTGRIRDLFDADGCSVLLLDPQRRELRFPVASQREAGSVPSPASLAEVRFPADRGIAGWVLGHDVPVLVEDAPNDPRFYHGVDRTTGLATRVVLAAPLRARAGNIGVVEVINPGGRALGPDDVAFLEALAGTMAVAYEKAGLYARMRGDVASLRTTGLAAGTALVLCGIALVGAAAFAHASRALPWATFPARPGVGLGLAGVLAGGALLWVVRRVGAARP